MFGKFIKELRTRRRIGLRQFCAAHGHDPSNWSKMERERLHPPQDDRTLGKWAKEFGLRPGSDDWRTFFNYAAVDLGRIPTYVLKDRRLLGHLPDFFRTLSRPAPSREDLETLLEKMVRTKGRSRGRTKRRSIARAGVTRLKQKKKRVGHALSNTTVYDLQTTESA